MSEIGVDTAIAPDSNALEAATEYAFNLGLTLDKNTLRWIIETYLEQQARDAETSA